MDKFVADLGDVDEAVLVDTDVHEDAEVDDIADGAGEHHAGLQILHFQHIRAENGRGELVTGISARFT